MSNSVFITPNGFSNNGSSIIVGSPLLLPDGTVSAPSLAAASTPTSGLFFVSGINLAGVRGGLAYWTLTSAGFQLGNGVPLLFTDNTTDIGANGANRPRNLYLGSQILNYNSIATVSNGIPSEVATIDSTGLTANVGATTLYVVPATGVGMYRVSAYLVTTTAASVSSTMPNAQVVFTDNDSNTSVTLDVSPILGAAGLGQSGTLAANAIGTVFSGTVVIYVKASTTIQYQTVNYVSTAAGMAYSLRMKLEAL